MNSSYQDYKKYITFDYREAFVGKFRWKLAIGTNPCIRTRLNKRCTFCGFLDLESPLPADQVDQVLQRILEETSTSNLNRLELFVSGSFLDDVEVSPRSRRMVIEILNRTRIPEILIESRPEFITKKNLMPLTPFIDPHRLTIATGVETMNDQNRKYLSKGMTTKGIAKSIEVIAKAGMNFQAYLLFKPPYLSSDRQAIINFIHDVQTLINLTEEKQCPLVIAIQPMFIADSTPAVSLFEHGRFRPPWLYSIAFVLKILDALRARNKFRIILGNENDNVNLIAAPKNYTHPTSYEVCSCTQDVSTLLQCTNESEYRLKEVVESVLNASCSCKDIWQQELAGLHFEEVLGS